MKYVKVVLGIVCLFSILSGINCTGTPATVTPVAPEEPSVTVAPSAINPGIVRLPEYSGAHPAIIFVIDHIGKGINEKAGEGIVRQFAENDATVSAGILPFVGDKNSYDVQSVKYYVDAGILDISMNYDKVCLAGNDQECPGMSYDLLQGELSGFNDQFKSYYGTESISCILGQGLWCQDSYRAVEESGFKVVTASSEDDRLTSVQFVDYAGDAASNGVLRAPFAGNVCRFDKNTGAWGELYTSQSNNELFSVVSDRLEKYRIAVIEVSPEAFINGDNSVNAQKLAGLNQLIKYCQSIGEITNYSSWYKYLNNYVFTPPFQRTGNTPEYTGKAAIIFRLDDGAKGWYEDTTEEIIKTFQRNEVPVQVGIIPYLDGRASFDSSMLRKYLDEGVIDVSMHGFDWTYAQMDTSKSGFTYSQLLNNLTNARQQIKHYYGVDPVSFTVPNDFYDEAGYNAIKDAGFKIFATQQLVEPHPSIVPVDFQGNPGPAGMYRIPTASDVTVWDTDKKNWGDVFDVSKLRGLKYYTETPGFYFPREETGDLPFYSDFYYEADRELDKLGIAVVGVHPDAFITVEGKPDMAKLQKLEKVIQWSKDFASVTTFDQWYKYTEAKLKKKK
jgi:hypothetical protein